uniref:(northern house mosquito) hypothetical protein n=1 Tax=Culex pipiens TaxID=7175 RepID=A0A8D8F8Q1_CULPI
MKSSSSSSVSSAAISLRFVVNSSSASKYACKRFRVLRVCLESTVSNPSLSSSSISLVCIGCWSDLLLLLLLLLLGSGSIGGVLLFWFTFLVESAHFLFFALSLQSDFLPIIVTVAAALPQWSRTQN